MKDKKVNVAIVGATGYTGLELLRILNGHPEVTVKHITSRSEAGKLLCELFPVFSGSKLVYELPTPELFQDCEVVFFATPSGTALKDAPLLLEQGIKVIDLSADFRIADHLLWSKWYGVEHTAKQWLANAVYGLPEVNREKIKQAKLVANPGCYATAVQLGLLPLIENGLIDCKNIIADVKSGVSGAGRAAKVGLLHAEVAENFSAYNVAKHRHQPEIESQLRQATEQEVTMTFVPHLVPMIRGIHATIYVTPNGMPNNAKFVAGCEQAIIQRYKDEPFIVCAAPGKCIDTRSVRGTNLCRISLHQTNEQCLVITTVIDNLMKGAAGQAVQNMNLLLNFREQVGLQLATMIP